MVKVSFENKEKVQIISFEGELNYLNVANAKMETLANLKEKDGYILNLDALEMIDSTGFGLIVFIGKTVMQYDGKVVLVVNDELIKELITISKIDQIFDVVNSNENAMSIIENI